MDRNSRLNRILRHLILRSFPKLRRRNITIRWCTDDELLYYTVHAEQYVIAVNSCLEQAGRRVLEGGIAHELCHIDADLKLGWYQRRLAWNRYSESYWYRMREERATEWRVVELGYGLQLLNFIRFAHRLGYTFAREHGLFYAEILRAEVLRTQKTAPTGEVPQRRRSTAKGAGAVPIWV
ncbi:MAG TPA: hypothetical protein VH640_21290 [Bryobacteraceae bacterium]|jgi:hypothetical protein